MTLEQLKKRVEALEAEVRELKAKGTGPEPKSPS